MRPVRLTLSALIILLAVLSGNGRALRVVGSAQDATPAGGDRRDLAVLTLRPGDLGETGWRHEGAFVQDLPALAQDHAGYLSDGTKADAVASTLAAAGWEQQYVSVVGRFSDDPGRPDVRVRSYVTQYASTERAAVGFAYLEDEGAVATATDIPTDRTYGEASELTADGGTSTLDGRDFRSLDLTFRVGNLVAGVTLVSYAPADLATPDQATRDGATPDHETVGQLAALVEDRIAQDGGPGLSTRVLRITPDGHEVVTLDDAYYWLSAADVPLAEEAPRSAALRTASYSGATDVYQLWQGVDTAAAAGVLYGVTLLRFPDDAEAEEWVDGLESTLAENPFYGDLRFEAGSSGLGLGDQAVALSYAAGGGGGDAPRAMLVAVRVGAEVARVHLVPQGDLPTIPLEPVTALAQKQAACLGESACGSTTGFPTALADLITGAGKPGATSVVLPVASPAAP